jgi:hypothetical protein
MQQCPHEGLERILRELNQDILPDDSDNWDLQYRMKFRKQVATLSKFSLLCHSFKPLAQAELFRNVHLHVSERAVTTLVHATTQRLELVSHVRSMRIAYFDDKGASLLEDLAGCLTAVETLSISECTFQSSVDFTQFLARLLNSLKALHVKYVACTNDREGRETGLPRLLESFQSEKYKTQGRFLLAILEELSMGVMSNPVLVAWMAGTGLVTKVRRLDVSTLDDMKVEMVWMFLCYRALTHLTLKMPEAQKCRGGLCMISGFISVSLSQLERFIGGLGTLPQLQSLSISVESCAALVYTTYLIETLDSPYNITHVEIVLDFAHVCFSPWSDIITSGAGAPTYICRVASVPHASGCTMHRRSFPCAEER